MSSTRLVRDLEDLLLRARQHSGLYGDAESLLGRHDPQFVYQLQGILKRVAGRELRRKEQKDNMELRDKNRTLQSLSSPSVPKLEEEVIATVWGWAKHQKSFFTSGIKTDTSSPILDSVCQHLIYNKDVAFQINTIHTRLLVYFLARFVNEKLTDTRDMDQVVKLVVDSGWISPNPGLIDLFKENFLKWLKAGKRFIGLVELLGVGAGVIIFVPLIRASTLESHCPRTGPYAHSIKEKLQDMGVPAAASSRRDGWTGHEVVQTLMEHLFAQSTISFVSCDPATEPPATIPPATETRRWLRRPPESRPSPD